MGLKFFDRNKDDDDKPPLSRHPDQEVRDRRWTNLNKVQFSDLTDPEKEEFAELQAEMRSRLGKAAFAEDARQNQRQEKHISDYELDRKYGGMTRGTTKGLSINEFKQGFPEGLKIAGLELVQPRDEWLAEKRAEEEMKRAGREQYNEARQKAYEETQYEKGLGKYSTRKELAKQAREKMLLEKEARSAEIGIARQQTQLEAQKIALERQKLGLSAAAMRMQEDRMPRGGGGGLGFGNIGQIQFDPMAGLGKLGGAPGNWSPMAGLEKFMGQGSERSSGSSMPDFSRFVNPDPTAGLSKLWGSQKPQQPTRTYTRKRKHKRRKK